MKMITCRECGGNDWVLIDEEGWEPAKEEGSELRLFCSSGKCGKQAEIMVLVKKR